MLKRILRILIVLAPICWSVNLISLNLRSHQERVDCLCINELMAKSLGSEDDSVCDWIEIYNGSDKLINLKGYGISNEQSSPYKYIFQSQIIEPGEYLLIYAGENLGYCDTQRGIIYCDFNLDASGGTVYLTGVDGSLVDCLSYGSQTCNISFGRAPYSYETLLYFSNATPGEPNTMEFVDNLDELTVQVEFNKKPGIYESEFEVALSVTEGTIIYSTDGSVPTENSLIYREPIKIEEKKYGEGTVIRARVYKAGKLGPVTTHTYFVHSVDINPYVNKMVALTVDPCDMFGNSGIYMLGNMYSFFKLRGGNEYQANYMLNESIDGNLEIFAKDSIDNTFCSKSSVSIAGGAGRTFQQKSLIISLNEEYLLNELETSEVKLRPRGGAEAVNYSKIDRYLEDLCKGLDLGCTEGEYADLYINGEYWGLYVIQEAIGESYWQNHYGLKAGEICSSHGSNKDVKEYEDFSVALYEKDFLIEEDFIWLCENVDIQNLTDYIIVECFLGNHDWGVGHENCEAWKYKGDDIGNGYKDGKWRFRLYDLDKCFETETIDTSRLEEELNKDIVCGDTSATPVLIIQKLMERKDYRVFFYKRHQELLNSTFEKETMLNKWDEVFEITNTEMPLNLEKYWEGFKQADGLREYYTTYDIWYANMMELRDNIDCRWDYINESLQNIK